MVRGNIYDETHWESEFLPLLTRTDGCVGRVNLAPRRAAASTDWVERIVGVGWLVDSRIKKLAPRAPIHE